MAPASPYDYSEPGWQNPWTEDPAGALFLLAIPLMFAILLMMAWHGSTVWHRRSRLAVALLPPLIFIAWGAIAVGKRHGALADELTVAGGAALGWLIASTFALASRSLNRRVEVGLIILIVTPIIFIGSGLVAREAAVNWLKHPSHVLAKQWDLHQFQIRERALEACVRNYSAETGRRDAARALADGDARLLYRVIAHQEGAMIYVPGVEIAGGFDQGWFPPDEIVQVLGRFGGDPRWYWVDVRETTTNAPWPDPWGWVGELSGQESKYGGKCERAEREFLEAYNGSIPSKRLQRRLAPAPGPEDLSGDPMIVAAHSDRRP